MAYTHASMDWGPEQGAGRWGHWAPHVLIAAVASTVLLGMFPPPGLLGALSPVLLLVVVIATWIQLRRHDRSLCEHCMAAMPLDPSASAQRYARRLALVHQGSRPRVIAVYLGVLLGANVALAVAPPALQGAAMALWVLAQSSLVYLVLSHVTHRRLQPWCTQCGGGGEEHDVHAPGPQPLGSFSG